MLCLDHVNSSVQARVVIEFDDYIPVSVTCESTGSESSVYWRTKPNAYSLLEIALSSDTGELRTVTLTSIESGAVRVSDELAGSSTERMVHGLPCMNLSAWSQSDVYADRFCDATLGITLLVAQDTCTLQIGAARLPRHLVDYDSVLFGFDEQNALCSIEIPLDEAVHRQTLLGCTQQ